MTYMNSTETAVKIDWDVFEEGVERDGARKLAALGSYRLIPSVIVHMDEKKEAEIQKLIDAHGTDHMDVELEAERELKLAEARLGRFPISTPEEEAEWQKRFDEERARIGRRPSVSEAVAAEHRCTVCGKVSANAGLLASHKRTHEDKVGNVDLIQ